jgi:hypothetical protein
MEAMLIVATLGQRWRMRLAKDHPVVPEPLVTLRPKYGIKMVLEQRAVGATSAASAVESH